MLNYYH